MGYPASRQIAMRSDWTYSTEYRHGTRLLKPGTVLSIKGERGRWRFIQHISTNTGVEWIDVASGDTCIRSFRPDRIRIVHTSKKGVR